MALDTILNQKDTGVICIYNAIGQKQSTVAQVVRTLFLDGAAPGERLPVLGIEPLELVCFVVFWAVQLVILLRGMESRLRALGGPGRGMVVAPLQLRLQPVSRQQLAGDPRILGQHQIGRGQHIERPQRHVPQIPDRRRHQIEARRDGSRRRGGRGEGGGIRHRRDRARGARRAQGRAA